jgi:trimeric autotransporter adhesin
VGLLESDVVQLNRGLKRSYEGTAVALAMAGATLPAGRNFAVSGNWGTFRGEHGFAATAVARITDNVYAHGGLGFGADRGGVGGRAGLTFAW